MSDPGYARQKVWERDEGVCALCGLDTVALEAEWRSLPYLEREDFLFERIGVRRSAHYSLWEADHIVPVVEGGGGTGLENLRTLCLRCHRAETAKLARRRALARKGQATIL